MKRRAVFLDRDGTINRAIIRDGRPYPPDSVSQFDLLPGVEEALSDLRRGGLLTIVVTNQPDVATGRTPRDTVDAIHAWMRENLALDDIRTCFETETQATGRYKPGPGMLFEAAEQHRIDLERSFMIGDRWRDVGAGQAAGCFTYYVRSEYCERKPERPDRTVDSLAEAVEHILKSIDREKRR